MSRWAASPNTYARWIYRCASNGKVERQPVLRPRHGAGERHSHCGRGARDRDRRTRAPVGLGDVRGLEYALRLRDTIALSVVDTETAQHVDDFQILGKLRDRLFAGQMTDLVDGAHHFAVDGIVQYFFDETAVDLQKIHREVFQVSERRQAGAEVVERELAAQFLQRLDEPIGLREACDGRRLGDLEADLAGIQAAAMELIDHVGQEFVVAQALPRQVDRAHGEFLALVGLGYEPSEGIFDDPTIDLRSDAVTLRRRDEIVRRDDFALFVAHAQQQLVVRALLHLLQGQNGLAEEFEAPFLERIVDARRPLHLTAPTHQIDVVFFEAVDPVAARLLGRLTGAVGGAQYRCHVGILGDYGHHADAGAKPESALLPGEFEIAYGFPQRFSRSHGFIQRTALEQYPEFIAAQPRQRIAPADFGFEQGADLTQQGIAGAVPAGVVDDLELVQIQAAQGVGRFARFGALERPLHAVLELASIHQSREHVVTRVVAQTPVELARLAHIVEYQHAARNGAAAVANRRCRAFDVNLVAVAADEQHRPDRLDRTRAADRDGQRVFERFASLLV